MKRFRKRDLPHLSQAAVSRVSHQDMAHHPFGRVPSVPGLVDPEGVDVPVEVGLQIPGDIPVKCQRKRLSQEHRSFTISIRSRCPPGRSRPHCIPRTRSRRS